MSSPAQIILFASRAFSLKLYNIINWTHDKQNNEENMYLQLLYLLFTVSHWGHIYGKKFTSDKMNKMVRTRSHGCD